MSRGISKAQVIGNLTKDPNLRYTQKGTAVTNITIAVNHSKEPGDASFLDCVLWGQIAELMAGYGVKGSRVYVDGTLKCEAWEDKEGQQRKTWKLTVDSFLMLDGKQRMAGDEADLPTQKKRADQAVDDSDIPF